MPTITLGALNPGLLAQCPERPTPPNAVDLPVHVTKWGDTGPRVLLIHGGVQGGIGGGPSNFQEQKPLADLGWQLELIDRPGFGHSPSRGPDDMVADAILISGLLGDSCHLIGHSFGGAEALLAAAQSSGRVRSLILIEPALQPLVSANAAVEPGHAKVATELVSKFLLGAKTPAEFALTFAKSMGVAEDGNANPSLVNISQDLAKATALGCSLLQARGVSSEDMVVAAKTVRKAAIPTLVISGGYSEGQTATAEGVAAATNGTHVIVPCTSHFVQQANPVDFNQVVDRFMRDAEKRRGGNDRRTPS